MANTPFSLTHSGLTATIEDGHIFTVENQVYEGFKISIPDQEIEMFFDYSYSAESALEEIAADLSDILTEIEALKEQTKGNLILGSIPPH